MALVPPASSREEEGSEGRLHNFGNLCKVLGHGQRFTSRVGLRLHARLPTDPKERMEQLRMGHLVSHMTRRLGCVAGASERWT